MKLISNLGAIDGLLRVQDTYGLKSLDIARGHFGSMEMRNQTRTLPKLTSQNCFEIGYQAYRKGFLVGISSKQILLTKMLLTKTDLNLEKPKRFLSRLLVDELGVEPCPSWR